MTRHLDIGCGDRPRNPYRRDELFGVDLAAPNGAGPIRRANLALEPIPFESSSFESVSAYDFLEHVPRLLSTADGRSTRFPFIELMNEVWRVLRPGGLFYASTPMVPHPSAFVDPTHVNYITAESHDYFVRPRRTAAMYGFVGDFSLRRIQRWRGAPGPDYFEPPRTLRERYRHARYERRGECSHVIWEFEAIK